MAHKQRLRENRENTIINQQSSKQEKLLDKAINNVQAMLNHKFQNIRLHHQKSIRISEIVSNLRQSFPDIDFNYQFERSEMKPDGGIIYMVSKTGDKFPILITERKNQGTNDLRNLEGKPKQAKGNAIERLGKNVIGFRTSMIQESIFPFVCFGDGCDFASDSSILDRVVTIAMFGHLNTEYLYNQANGAFNRGTFYFRENVWTIEEITQLSYNIAERSVYYYFSKYGESTFLL
jgi:type II restriction enzyme